LFRYQYNTGASASQIGSDSQQERPAPCNYYLRVAYGQTRLDQRLQAARADDAGQRPAWKGQESLASAGCKDQLLEAELVCDLLRLSKQHPGARLSHNSSAADYSDI
jgi:hypothetical protein